MKKESSTIANVSVCKNHKKALLQDHHQHKELLFTLFTGLNLTIGFFLSFFAIEPHFLSLIFYLLAYFFGSYFLIEDIVAGIRQGKFDIDFLMLIAAIGAAILGKYSEGALLLFLFNLGHSLEHYALNKANQSIAGLHQIAPKTALVKRGTKEFNIPIEQLKIGDTVIIKPNTIVAADGRVIKGFSPVNQSTITGESIPVDKYPSQQNTHSVDTSAGIVFSGTLNGSGYLEIEVTRKSEDSTLSKLIRMINEAKAQKSDTQRLASGFTKVYVPVVLVVVFILNFAFLVLDEQFTDSFYRAITVLVVASPCALVISTPSAILSGIARAAKNGILFKGGKPLEELGRVKAIAFDKTGTLTKGKPRITDVIPLNGYPSPEILRRVVAVEKLSDHPLAKAIVEDGMQMLNGSGLPEVEDFESVTGKGIIAKVAGKQLRVGNQDIFEKPTFTENLRRNIDLLEKQGKTAVLIQNDKKFIGIIGMMDVPRNENQEIIHQLYNMGVKRITMLTGDNQRVANSVANKIGIKEAWGNLLPEDKVKAILKIKADAGRVVMIGDGVNDAPAMAHSTVSVAMGAAGSDIALETADIALMSDHLQDLPYAFGLSKKTIRIIRQNLLISMGVIAIMVPITLLGLTSIGPAVLIHEGSTVLVVFNALRLLSFRLKK